MTEPDSTGEPLPFQGLKVLDCASFIAAPVAATLLADLGADVIKVEPPSGDPHRTLFQRVGCLPDPALADKPRWLVLNKLDLIPEEDREKSVKDFVKAYKKATKYDGPVFPITAISGDGTKPLIYAIHEALEQMAKPEIPDDELESEDEPTFE